MTLLQNPTGNFWIDNGLVVLHKQLQTSVPTSVKGWKNTLQQLASQLYVPTGNEGEYWDAQQQVVKKYPKRNWKEPIGKFISAVGTAPKVTVSGRSYFTRPPADPTLKFEPKGKQACDFCGSVGPVEDAKMYLFPFIVDSSKFANFYPSGRRGLKMCARCAVAGFAAFQSWLWRRHDDNYHFFLFHTEDLSVLSILHTELIRPLTLQGSSVGNVDVPFTGKYPYENLLSFLLFMFSWLHSKSGANAGSAASNFVALLGIPQGANVPVVLYLVSGETKGKSFTANSLIMFDRFQRLYELYCSWRSVLPSSEPHKKLFEVFQQFIQQRNRSRETLWRDHIARAILQQTDPVPALERFVFEVGADTGKPLVPYTMEVFATYLKEVLEMDEKLLRVLQGFGYELGERAARQKEMGLLYALRNAKNLNQFLNVLTQVQFKLGMTINTEILRLESGERIAGAPWERVKSLLAIHAMNAYLQVQSRQSQKEANSNE